MIIFPFLAYPEAGSGSHVDHYSFVAYGENLRLEPEKDARNMPIWVPPFFSGRFSGKSPPECHSNVSRFSLVEIQARLDSCKRVLSRLPSKTAISGGLGGKDR